MNINREVSRRAIFSLKRSVLIGFLVFWNFGVIVAIYASGSGFGLPFTSQTESMLGIVLGLTSIFSVSIAANKSIQNWVIREDRREQFHSSPFYLLALITATIALFQIA